MFGDTITLNLAPEGETPVELIVTKVNQDGYSSEYRAKEPDCEHILVIRHSTEKQKLKGQPVERHNVTYTQNFFPTELNPQGRSVQAYSVIRNAPSDPIDAVSPLLLAVCRLSTAGAAKLLAWQS